MIKVTLPAKKPTSLVAVYGTLKLGFSNHRVMIESKGEYVGDDFIVYDKIDSYNYPSIRFKDDSKGNEKVIQVELYEVETLEPLDNLEGEGFLYKRRFLRTIGEKLVWTYEIMDEGITDRSDDYYVGTFKKDGRNLLIHNWDK